MLHGRALTKRIVIAIVYRADDCAFSYAPHRDSLLHYATRCSMSVVSTVLYMSMAKLFESQNVKSLC